jgi:hypothetical protein
MDLKEVLVSDVVGFYYSALRKSLTDVESINIKVDCLGTFKVKERQLVKLKCTLEDHLKRLDNPETFGQMKIKKEIEEKYANLSRVSSLLVSEKVRKKIHQEKKNDKNKGNLAE